MRKTTLGFGAAAIVAVGVSYLVYANISSKNGGEKPATEAKVAPAENSGTITALGRIEPNGQVIRLTAPSGVQGAIVTKLLVTEGDEVLEGEDVAILDGFEQQQAVVTEAQTRVTIARTRLDQILAGAKRGDLDAKKSDSLRLEAELSKARKELERAENRQSGGEPLPEYAVISRTERELANARSEFARSQRLFGTGDVSQSELDSRRLAVETGEKDLERSRAALQTVVREKKTLVETLGREIQRSRSELASLAEVRPTDIAAAEAEVDNARAAVDRAKADLDLRRVRSYAAGKVLKIHTRPGESVGNEGVLELGDTSTMVAVAEVFEAEIGKIKNGQRAEISVRTSGEKFSGEVVAIDPLIKKRDILDSDPVADVDSRVVEVRVRLDGEASRRLAGLTNLRVDVKFILN
jgi:HlyD family secretion protein